MKVIEDLCQPALLYLLYLVVHVGLDLSLGMYITAVTKTVFGLAAVYLLNVFCEVDLGIVSWLVIATPFVITALATALALGLNLDKGLSSLAAEHFTPNPKTPQVDAGEPPLSTDAMY
jgi:hypothetical protein